jgi:ParB/RepB/Spo0J family partition protein
MVKDKNKWDPLAAILAADSKTLSVKDYLTTIQSDEAIVSIEMDNIVRWEHKDRPEDELGNIDELAETFKAVGQQQPCILRSSKKFPGKYELLVGERRWKAAEKAGLPLKGIIKEIDDKTATLIQVIENDKRKDISEYAKGMSYAKKIAGGIITQMELIDILHISKQQISRLLSYSKIPESLSFEISDFRKVSSRTAESLGLDFTMLSEKEKAELFSGNSLPTGADPIAQAYAGHQFGHFTLLGDGRAIVLGEHLAPDNQRVDLQLKGSGRTPYSRRGDGLAALGPMLREYLISEAMHALGIPTTRSLAVVTTGENVIRETVLPGAVLTRVAASHIRVGTFEYVAMQNDKQLLKTMVMYILERHYPALKAVKNPTLELLKAVMERQITLMIHWMRVGFIHGVMNTDNMAISGESIDYGPCAFMNAYDLKTVFSSIDYHGRYAFGNQSKIAQWNLTRFAETLLPLFHETQEEAIQMATDVLNRFAPLYHDQWLSMMRKKLGIFGEESEDEELINDLLHWMQKNQMDYTNTFQLLQSSLLSDTSIFQDKFADKAFQTWHQRWRARLSRNAQPLKSSVKLLNVTEPNLKLLIVMRIKGFDFCVTPNSQI